MNAQYFTSLFTSLFAVMLAGFLAGFFYSTTKIETRGLTSQIAFYKKAGKIQHEIQTMSDAQLCLCLGGLRAACRPLASAIPAYAAHARTAPPSPFGAS